MALAFTLAAREARAETVNVRAPMACSRGSDAQAFTARVTMPAAQPTGSTFTVRIDSNSSGTISHFGLYYLYGMRTDYTLSPGVRVVSNSVRLVPGTGTANVRVGARAWSDAAGVHLLLPARVNDGQSYTPPSVEFELVVEAAAGSAVTLQFARYEVWARAFLVGDIRTICTPAPAPATIGTTRVTPPTTP